jgi:hypothetical protein
MIIYYEAGYEKSNEEGRTEQFMTPSESVAKEKVKEEHRNYLERLVRDDVTHQLHNEKFDFDKQEWIEK